MMDWHDIFEYDKGNLVRLYSNNQHKHVGWVNSAGYKQVEVEGKSFMLHRIIYEMFNGKIPKGLQIDHINRDTLDNRIENLRLCSQSENRVNSKLPKNNTIGYKGVIKTPNGKFQARLGYNGKKLYLGLFETAEEASRCIEINRRELFGEFADSL